MSYSSNMAKHYIISVEEYEPISARNGVEAIMKDHNCSRWHSVSSPDGKTTTDVYNVIKENEIVGVVIATFSNNGYPITMSIKYGGAAIISKEGTKFTNNTCNEGAEGKPVEINGYEHIYMNGSKLSLDILKQLGTEFEKLV